jgi:hypothetical protein
MIFILVSIIIIIPISNDIKHSDFAISQHSDPSAASTSRNRITYSSNSLHGERAIGLRTYELEQIAYSITIQEIIPRFSQNSTPRQRRRSSCLFESEEPKKNYGTRS